mgnify:CR=1 FL=1
MSAAERLRAAERRRIRREIRRERDKIIDEWDALAVGDRKRTARYREDLVRIIQGIDRAAGCVRP